MGGADPGSRARPRYDAEIAAPDDLEDQGDLAAVGLDDRAEAGGELLVDLLRLDAQLDRSGSPLLELREERDLVGGQPDPPLVVLDAAGDEDRLVVAEQALDLLEG